MRLVSLAFAVLLLGALAHADVIEPGTHPIDKCVKVIWRDSMPDYVVIGAVSPISSTNPVEFVQITNNTCINAGMHYKFDRFEIYYAKSGYISQVGLSGIKTVPDQHGRMMVSDENLAKPAMLSLDSISAPYAPYYVSDSDGSKSVTIAYNLYPCRGVFCISKLSEVKSQHLITQEAPYPGEPDSPPAPPGDDMPPSPPGDDVPPAPPADPISSFICWLLGIFGGKC